MPIRDLHPEAEVQANAFASSVDKSFGKGGALVKKILDLLFDDVVKPNIDVDAIDKNLIADLLKRLAPLFANAGPFLKLLASLLPVLLVFLNKTPVKPNAKDKITTI
jgi:hypothetical protein